MVRILAPCLLTFLLTTVFSGCNSSGGASMDEMASAVSAQKAAEQQKQDAAAAAETEAAEKKAADEKAAKAQTQAEPERRAIGRTVQHDGTYFGAIIGARRHILNETESWAWKQGVNHFRATNGRKPKDNEEFMTKVIQEMDIKLPPKQDNEEYLYDPNEKSDGDFGQLFVVEKQPGSQNPPTPGSAPPPK